MRGLYAIVDVTTVLRARLEVLAVAEAILDARPACLQLRAKDLPARATLDLLRSLRPLARRAGVPLFANDRPDLAMLAACDGVHVGQDDLSPTDVRAVTAAASRSLLLGLSTHRREQVLDALEAPIDYLAIGPIFATPSKKDHDPALGVDELRSLVRLARTRRPSLPIVAIGGLAGAKLDEVAPLVDAVAVVGAIMPGENMPKPAALDAVRARTAGLVEACARANAGRP